MGKDTENLKGEITLNFDQAIFIASSLIPVWEGCDSQKIMYKTFDRWVMANKIKGEDKNGKSS